MCTIIINETHTLSASGDIVDFTISGSVTGQGSQTCDKLLITITNANGLIASAAGVTLGSGGSYSATLKPTVSVRCGKDVTIKVECQGNPECTATSKVFVACETHDCPTISIDDIETICDAAGNRVVTVTFNFSQPCSFEVRTPASALLYAGGASVAGPVNAVFTVPTTPAFLNLHVNVTQPAGCTGMILPLSVATCPVPCPQVTCGPAQFSDCIDGKRQVTLPIGVSSPASFTAKVYIDGSTTTAATLTAGNPNASLSLLWAGGSSHTVFVDVGDPMCGDSSFVIQVPDCVAAEPCPTIHVTPTFGDCHADGTRTTTIVVSVSGNANYVGQVMFDGAFDGTVTGTAPHTIVRGLAGGSSHAVDVAAVNPGYCGMSTFDVPVPKCDPNQPTDPSEPDKPKIPCAICTRCQDYLTKIGKTLWGTLACKLLMILVVASIAAVFSEIAGGLHIYSNNSYSPMDWLVLFLGFVGALWFYLLLKNCGACCVYCALLWGVILGIIAAIIVFIYTDFAAGWMAVWELLFAAIFLLWINETQFRPQCDADLI